MAPRRKSARALAEVWGEEGSNNGRNAQITDGNIHSIVFFRFFSYILPCHSKGSIGRMATVMDYESLLFMTMTHSPDDLI